MKTINVIFEDKEFKALTKLKEQKTWREFFLSMTDWASKNEDFLTSELHQKLEEIKARKTK